MMQFCQQGRMTNPAQSFPDPPATGDSLARRPELPPAPLARQNQTAITPDTPLRYIEAPAESKPSTNTARNSAGGAVLRGLKDLQQLQKQTILVLESLKSSLDDIHQVLR